MRHARSSLSLWVCVSYQDPTQNGLLNVQAQCQHPSRWEERESVEGGGGGDGGNLSQANCVIPGNLLTFVLWRVYLKRKKERRIGNYMTKKSTQYPTDRVCIAIVLIVACEKNITWGKSGMLSGGRVGRRGEREANGYSACYKLHFWQEEPVWEKKIHAKILPPVIHLFASKYRVTTICCVCAWPNNKFQNRRGIRECKADARLNGIFARLGWAAKMARKNIMKI